MAKRYPHYRNMEQPKPAPEQLFQIATGKLELKLEQTDNNLKELHERLDQTDNNIKELNERLDRLENTFITKMDEVLNYFHRSMDQLDNNLRYLTNPMDGTHDSSNIHLPDPSPENVAQPLPENDEESHENYDVVYESNPDYNEYEHQDEPEPEERDNRDDLLAKLSEGSLEFPSSGEVFDCHLPTSQSDSSIVEYFSSPASEIFEESTSPSGNIEGYFAKRSPYKNRTMSFEESKKFLFLPNP